MEPRPKQYLLRNLHALQGQVVSVGCGRGVDELHLARRGRRVLATDIDQAKLDSLSAIAEQEGLAQLATQQLDTAGQVQLGQTFDSAYSGFLLHLFPMSEIRRVVLPNLHSLLRPNGAMMLVYRLVDPDRFRDRFQVSEIANGEVEALDVQEGTTGRLSIIPEATLTDLLGDLFRIEDLTTYTEPAYNRMSGDMNSEAIGVTLRRAC